MSKNTPFSKETLSDIGGYILNGMSEQESCILSGVLYKDLQVLQEGSDTVRDYIKKKHIQFKHNHLREIQSKKSEKTSQWLLEKLRPEEFGTKAKSAPTQTINIIGSIIKDIQNNDADIIRHSRDSRLSGGGESDEDDSRPRLQVAHLS